MIAGLEESQCHSEVSTTLCTTPSNTLNTCHSAALGEYFDIYVTKKPAEDNALTRFNVALWFLHVQHPKQALVLFLSDVDTLISEAKNQR